MIDPLSEFLKKPGHVCRAVTGPGDRGCAGGFTRLNVLQVQALCEFHDFGGLWLQGPLGCGKTGVAGLAPTLLQEPRALYIVPGSGINSGKVMHEINIMREHWNVVPFQMVSYQKLAREEQEFFFFEPPGPYGMIILDEAHYCRNEEAAVTRRIHRLREKAGQEITVTRIATGQKFRVRVPPPPKTAVMTATPIKDSLADVAHTMQWSHGDGSPVPIDASDLADWCGALDAEPPERYAPGALTVFSGGKEDLESVRRGVGKWIFETPGFVSSSETFVEAKLSITLRDVPLESEDPWFRVLRGDPNDEENFPGWTTPDGDIFTEAAELWRHACSLALGYYTIWWRHEGFTQCLNNALTQNDVPEILSTRPKPRSGIAGTVRRILSAFAHTTEIDSDLVKAVELLTGTVPLNIGQTSSFSTESRKSTMTSSSRSTQGSVTSAASPPSDVEVDSWLTTITRRDVSGGYCARAATARLDSYLTMLKRVPELLPILQEAIEATKAPPAWRLARFRWHHWAREVLKASRTIDTLAQLATAVDNGLFDSYELPGGATPRGLLEAWREIQPTFIPNSVPRWVGDTALRYAMNWLEGGGIVWTGHRHFGVELSRRTGCPFFSSEGTSEDGQQSIVTTQAPGIIASSVACKEQFNLQRYNRNLIASVWPVGKDVEQLIGRTHRQGQRRDVSVEWMISCLEQLNGFARAASVQAPMLRDLMRVPSRLCGAQVQSDKITTSGWAFAEQDE